MSDFDPDRDALVLDEATVTETSNVPLQRALGASRDGEDDTQTQASIAEKWPLVASIGRKMRSTSENG